MAYCPQCGREQRCGCEECHYCGVKLVDRLPAEIGQNERITPEAGPVTPVGIQKFREPGGDTGAASSPAVRTLPTLLVVLGYAALLIIIMGMINRAIEIMGLGGGTGSLKRVGYFFGNILYASSAWLILAFAVIIAGFLIQPPRPFARRANWQGGTVLTGGIMGLASAGCFLSVIFLIIPSGSRLDLAVEYLLPSLAIAIPVLIIMGTALLWAAHILVSRSLRRPEEYPGKESESGGQGLIG